MDPFLKMAIDEARLGLSEGGIPIGSVLVLGGAFAVLAAADAVDDAGSILLAVAVTAG